MDFVVQRIINNLIFLRLIEKQNNYLGLNLGTYYGQEQYIYIHR